MIIQARVVPMGCFTIGHQPEVVGDTVLAGVLVFFEGKQLQVPSKNFYSFTISNRVS